jgi:hypothetical protein
MSQLYKKPQKRDHAVRVRFCNRFCETVCSGSICVRAAYFVDETWFYLNGQIKTSSDSRYWLEKEHEMGILLYCMTEPVEQLNGPYSLLCMFSSVSGKIQ